MNSNKVSVFLPCRKNSQRIPKKNIKPFAGIEGGLVLIKLQQLIKIENINQIILSTDDEEVKAIGRRMNHPKIIIDDRPAYLAQSSTSTDELIAYVPTIIPNDHILWTHVTSPFIDSMDYEKMITEYFNILGGGKYDSLMTVTKLHKFLWNENGPLNYDRSVEKWPRTQTLPPIYEVNSGAFIAHTNIYKTLNDRIGERPYFYELDESKSYDIDWEINFKIAEQIWSYGEKV